MLLSLLPSLLLAILLVGYTPGPANLFALHCSMKNGVRKALVMWLGLLAGFTVAAVIAAVVTHEVGAMMGRYVVILKYLGCAYILYLAWQIYHSSGQPKGTDKTWVIGTGTLIHSFGSMNLSLVIFVCLSFTI